MKVQEFARAHMRMHRIQTLLLLTSQKNTFLVWVDRSSIACPACVAYRAYHRILVTDPWRRFHRGHWCRCQHRVPDLSSLQREERPGTLPTERLVA